MFVKNNLQGWMFVDCKYIAQIYKFTLFKLFNTLNHLTSGAATQHFS